MDPLNFNSCVMRTMRGINILTFHPESMCVYVCTCSLVCGVYMSS